MNLCAADRLAGFERVDLHQRLEMAQLGEDFIERDFAKEGSAVEIRAAVKRCEVDPAPNNAGAAIKVRAYAKRHGGDLIPFDMQSGALQDFLGAWRAIRG